MGLCVAVLVMIVGFVVVESLCDVQRNVCLVAVTIDPSLIWLSERAISVVVDKVIKEVDVFPN